MPATVIAEGVGWQGSPSWMRESVARPHTERASKDPVGRLCQLFAGSESGLDEPRRSGRTRPSTFRH